MAIHPTLETAFQVQLLLEALTENPPLPPWYVNCCGDSCTAYEHDGSGVGVGDGCGAGVGLGEGLGVGRGGGPDVGAASCVRVTV